MPTGGRRRVLVAGLSVRLLAEACRDAGFDVVAADCFGDADTRAASGAWWPVGADGALRIDRARLLNLLERVARSGECEGWIAGSGFEGQIELLDAGARALPLWGNGAGVVDAVRDPRRFFGALATLAIDYPPVRFEPTDADDWLYKDFGACGGWHIRSAARPGPRDARGYFQRIAAGVPMSVLFLAGRGGTTTVGYSRQLVRRLGARPYVYRGCIGPVALPEAVCDQLASIVEALVAYFGLRGVNGLDFLLEGGRVTVLELNPRPVASLAVHAGAVVSGLMRAHVAVCAADGPVDWLPGRASGEVRGYEVAFARRRTTLSARACEAIAATGWCHDQPLPGARLAWGDPVCSVSAVGLEEAHVEGELALRRKMTRTLVEH